MKKQNSPTRNATRYTLHATQAFTLIEVLLVLGITAVLLVVGVTNMLGYIGRQSLETEARALVALMRDAQSRAMAQQEESRWGVYLVNNTGETRDAFSIFQVDETLISSSTYTGIPGITMEQKTMRSNIEFVSPTEGTSTALLFSKISGLPSASTTFTMQIVGDSENQKTIFINGNGKIDYQ